MNLPFSLIRPALHALDAERAHRLTIRALKLGLGPCQRGEGNSVLTVQLGGLTFPNPLGLAAGFDKNAEVPDAMLAMGFGYSEIGTVTPRPQTGNPRPRLFRLSKDRAVINRMGFNNDGLEAVKARLARRLEQGKAGVVGVNLGANKDTGNRVANYITGLEGLHGLASYFTINISSPNTPGLRDLQGGEALQDLLERLLDTRAQLTAPGAPPVPLFLKLAPDLTGKDMDGIATVLEDFPVDALILTNTTISRPDGLSGPARDETGGLSGKPLFASSTACLAAMAERLSGQIPLIGVGGIFSGADAYAKIRAGASAVQLYTALVFDGPELLRHIKRDIKALLRQDGFNHLSEAVGADLKERRNKTE